ncbi:MAG: DEAD/DEAH box helicase [Desulfovibrio sp.]|jgi:ATP-dependent RNA helicase DeaD|nr:DEAD/DEAH box helicase [Desulfovibrio sp.]
MTSFADLGLSSDILRAIADMGFEEPSPIQVLAIPPLLAGKDIVGQAQTGTGKTAAFGIPLLERLPPRQTRPRALVLCPTRELAIQVAEELGRLAAYKRGVRVLPVYGGQSLERQFQALERGAQIIAGTPGRILDHLDRGSLSLDEAATVVLDEADEMLDMGFYDDIESILRRTPEGCQKVLFSATMPGPILELAKQFLPAPEILKVIPKILTVPSIEQTFYEVRPDQKLDALCRVLDAQGLRKGLVFCATKRGVDDVASHLQARGYLAEGLHGDLAQARRERVMGRFRAGTLEVLVATDVAARGIDVEDVEAVINYDIPHDVEDYVHRVGRTGRAGRGGKAFTFVAARDRYRLREIMRFTRARIEHSPLPTLHDVAALKTDRILEEARAVMEAGSLERYTSLMEDFMEKGATGMDMAAALLKILLRRDIGPDSRREVAGEDLRFSGPTQVPRGEDSRPAPPWAPPVSRPRGGRKPGPPGTRHSSPRVRLSFNVGSRLRVTPGDLLGAIAGETGISGRSIGAIEIHDNLSFVDVPGEQADEIVRIMNAAHIRGLRLSVRRAGDGLRTKRASGEKVPT